MSLSRNSFDNIFLLNYLNDILNQLNDILIYEFELIGNIEESICECVQLIDQFCKEKSNKEDLNYVINKINFLINNLNINEDDIKQIKLNLNKIDQLINPIEEIKIISCLKDESFSYHFCLSPENSFYPYLISPKQIINISSDKNWFALSTNEKHLLIIGKSKIYLFNKNFKIVNEKLFIHQGIKDICWSKTLRKFILISPKQIYILDENKMIIKPLKLYFNINKCWERGTSSETFLFLSTFGENPSIIIFNLYPSIQFNKQYQKEIISHKNQIINDIKYADNHLAIIIEDNLNNQSYFQLRELKYFQLIWIVSLGNGWNYRSTLFNQRYWIISDYYNKRFIHILNDGNIIKIENYFSKPENIISWIQNQIIIRTIQNIYIHQSQ